MHPSVVDLGNGHLKVFFRDRVKHLRGREQDERAHMESSPPHEAAEQQRIDPGEQAMKSAFNASIATSGQGLVLVFGKMAMLSRFACSPSR